MARLPQPGADQGQWGQILNDFLAQVHNTDGTLKPNIVDETSLGVTGGTDGQVLVKDTGSSSGISWATPSSTVVSDATAGTKGIVQLAGDLGGSAASPTVPGLALKLDASQKGAVNGVASLDSGGKVPSAQLPTAPVTTVATRTGDVVLTKSDVGLSNVDNTSDANKPVSGATQTALNAKADSTHSHAISDVTGLQTALDGKQAAGSYAATVHSHVISDTTGLQTALDGKAATSHTHTLDGLSDVSASGATDGQSLVYNAGSWGPADVGTGSTVVDATSSVKGVVQLSGDLGGTAAAPTVPGLAGKANTSHTHAATDINSGVIATARLGSGTANGTTYLRGDGTWATPSGGGSSTTVVNRSSTYTAVAGDFILADASGGAFTITLPALTNGDRVSVKKIDASAFAVTISGTIDNLSSYAISTQWESQDFICNGTQWYLI